MLLCLSGLSAIPDYLYEAAAIDRASAWFQFRRITLPQVDAAAADRGAVPHD